MSKRSAAVLVEAMKLSKKERAELAEGLLESLDGPATDIDSMSEEDFKAELDRRREELIKDPSLGIPWGEVKRLTHID